MTKAGQGVSPSFILWCQVLIIKMFVVLVVDHLAHQDGKAVNVSLQGAQRGHLWEPSSRALQSRGCQTSELPGGTGKAAPSFSGKHRSSESIQPLRSQP